jgi:hypothetical protein
MPNQPKTPVVGVRIPTPVREALQREADAKEETLSELIRAILTRHAKRQKPA